MEPIRLFPHRSPRFASSRHLSLTARQVVLLLISAAAILGNALTPLGAAEPVRTSRGTLTLPTYPWWPAVKHPYFRGTDRVNIYPYPMLDFLSRERTNRTYQTVVLENDYLRITFLPELGGRVHEVLDKTTGQPMFYVNHVIKPGLIGQCGAWISGGVEWNTGPQGHTVGCMQPVSVVVLPRQSDGSQSVAIGETERIYGTRWTVVVTLRPGRSFIEESIRIDNRTETIRPYYFWNCTAVPNTPGFRFIYPMTLGTDHGAERFFQWPIHEGTDLSRGTNYQDASSIFAWYCDQDFFGSYNDDLRRGVVACANHQQLPGKKAWTWGWGSYGTMHQMDLTDGDGPYNEVQTGPLLTQGEVGRLDPGEAVAWQEWWYPIHDLGGFVFANRHLAVNTEHHPGQPLTLRLLGTGTWPSATLTATRAGTVVAREILSLSPREPATTQIPAGDERVEITVDDGDQVLARFSLPLNLPSREPPAKTAAARTPSAFAAQGWQHFLFARLPEARAEFLRALEADPDSAFAHTGLAFANLDSDPASAAQAAQAAVRADPDHGLAWHALALARFRLQDDAGALDAAWLAARDPKTASAARSLVATLLIRQGKVPEAIECLSEPGPWQSNPGARNLLAIALLASRNSPAAARLAHQNLELDPLDTLAGSVLWQIHPAAPDGPLAELLTADPRQLLELVVAYARLGQEDTAAQLLDAFSDAAPTEAQTRPLLAYWRAYLASRQARAGSPVTPRAQAFLQAARTAPSSGVFPHHPETVVPLRWALTLNPDDGKAALYLGHLLFSLGREDEARRLWQAAADLGVEQAIAWRALGMASLTLDDRPADAAGWLARANQADPADAIVARDLARVLFRLGDSFQSDEPRQDHWRRIRDLLHTAFPQGRGRSDFVALLARAHNRLGEFAQTAELLDSVRITIWEGAREAHDLFEEAHLALATVHLDAGRAAEALREADRALEYPENLATGRLENTREAHIHELRGRALEALGRREDALAAWRLAAKEPESNDRRRQEARQRAQAALDRLTRQ